MAGRQTTTTTATGIAIPSRDGYLSFDPKTLSTTPGGTIYATTPGGTRIVYDRNALLLMRNSPFSNTPPRDLPVIPGVTSPINPPDPPSSLQKTQAKSNTTTKTPQKEHVDDDETLFNLE